jgi:hypothetical protein
VTSREKVLHALDQAELLVEQAEMPFGVKMAAGALTLARPALEGMIPAEPADVDELLERGASWFLSLRSDQLPA